MNGRERDPRVDGHDCFRAVAVMGVEIPDRDPVRALLQRVERSDRDVIEKTKTHRLIARRVVSGRSHKAKGALSA